MAQVLSNYNTCRKYGAKFIVLTTDLWGVDGGQPASAPYPGDNGDWTNYDAFLTRLVADLKVNNATTGVAIDIWNEPDLAWAWENRPQSQYLDMWGRGYERLRYSPFPPPPLALRVGQISSSDLTFIFRQELPDVELIGPATAFSPSLDNSWWVNFASFVKRNNTIPDQWVWHMETGSGDMETSRAGLFAILEKFRLPKRPINIDEYATAQEQTPVFSAWWIAQLERVNAYGLRGIWLSAAQVYDFFTGILSKPNADNSNYDPNAGGYYPNGQYQVYQYYALNMTGQRIATLPSSDRTTDVYATLDSEHLKLLYGSRALTTESYIQINNLSSIGLPDSGTLNLKIWGFPYPDGRFGEVDAPIDLGNGQQGYHGGSVTFPVYPVDGVTAYAFEVSVLNRKHF